MDATFTIHVARTFWERLLGLMFRPKPPAYGLLFPNTNAIHTFFMRFPIDVLAFDTKGNLLEVRRALRPWRIAFFRAPAYALLEVAPGTGSDWSAYLQTDPDIIRQHLECQHISKQSGPKLLSYFGRKY